MQTPRRSLGAPERGPCNSFESRGRCVQRSACPQLRSVTRKAGKCSPSACLHIQPNLVSVGQSRPISVTTPAPARPHLSRACGANIGHIRQSIGRPAQILGAATPGFRCAQVFLQICSGIPLLFVPRFPRRLIYRRPSGWGAGERARDRRRN